MSDYQQLQACRNKCFQLEQQLKELATGINEVDEIATIVGNNASQIRMSSLDTVEKAYLEKVADNLRAYRNGQLNLNTLI